MRDLKQEAWDGGDLKLGFVEAADSTKYVLDRNTGQLRRLHPKVRGKKARKAEKRARRIAKKPAIIRLHSAPIADGSVTA